MIKILKKKGIKFKMEQILEFYNSLLKWSAVKKNWKRYTTRKVLPKNKDGKNFENR